MSAPRFSEMQWARVYEFLRSCPGIYARQEEDIRRFVETVLWVARAGAAWRLLPEALGHWNSVYKRFARWQEKGVWQELLQHLSADADLEWAMIDSTVVRAHACAAGASQKKGRRRSAGHAAASRPRSTGSPTAWATRSASR